MDRLDVMRLFTRIVECRSFTQAAEDLGLLRSTATQAIKQLEARLGVRLLQRTTRHVRPTLDGEAYYRAVLPSSPKSRMPRPLSARPSRTGLLRVDVHGTLARHFVLPALPAFLARLPRPAVAPGRRRPAGRPGARRLRLRAARGRAAGQRHGRPTARLAGRGDLRQPGLSDRHGTPASIERWKATRRSASSRPPSLPRCRWNSRRWHAAPRHACRPRLTVASAETYVATARLGLGLIQVPRYHVADDLRAGTLVSVLDKHPPTPTPVSLLYPHNRQLSPRVRVFIDWLVREFGRTTAEADPSAPETPTWTPQMLRHRRPGWRLTQASRCGSARSMRDPAPATAAPPTAYIACAIQAAQNEAAMPARR